MAVEFKIEAQRGEMPVLQFCTPAQLRIDPSYQRSTDAQASRTLINRITRKWDWRLYQPLVVARRADGGLYVVDGQHRLEAARQRADIAQLPCVITAYDGAQEEAAAFVELNQARKPLSQLNLFKAAVAAGDPDAALIQSIVETAGFRLTGAADRNAWKPGWIDNIVSVRHCHRQHGDRVLRLALEAIGKAFEGQVLRYCGSIFSATYPVVAAAGANYSPLLMIDILRDADQAGWIARFRVSAAERGVSVAIAARELLGTAYAEATAE